MRAVSYRKVVQRRRLDSSTMNSLLSLVLLGSLLGTLEGYKMYQDRIPNGGRVPHPCLANYVWHGVGHKNVQGGGERNVFGLDFAANSYTWDQTLCQKDSDGDGMTNGQELGDPNCVWTVGSAPSQTTGLSHPGVCEPLSSGNCNATNNWDFCSQTEFECSILNTTDVKNVTLSLDSTTLPATETNYYCQVFDLPNATDYHIIADQPALDNENVIHHMLLFGCGVDTDNHLDAFKTPQPCSMQSQGICGTILSGWTVGSVGSCNTGEAGVKIGPSTFTRALLQVHWNNPSLRSDYTDGSGLTLYYTANLRPYDLATLTVGQMGLRIPPGETSWTHTATCPSSCTQSKITQTMKVVGVNLHMHYLGAAGSLTQMRNGVSVNSLANQTAFSYDSPVVEAHSPPKELMAGDELLLSCEFKSTSHSSTVYYGDGTQSEMCFAFITYYPAQAFTSCSQFGSATVCQNETNPAEIGYCSFGATAPEQAAYAQLGSTCDTTGNTCTSQCLALLTENPNSCLSGNAKLFGEFIYPRFFGSEDGTGLQSASRSCDVQIYDSSATSVTSVLGKMVLSLFALLVTMI